MHVWLLSKACSGFESLYSLNPGGFLKDHSMAFLFLFLSHWFCCGTTISQYFRRVETRACLLQRDVWVGNLISCWIWFMLSSWSDASRGSYLGEDIFNMIWYPLKGFNPFPKRRTSLDLLWPFRQNANTLHTPKTSRRGIPHIHESIAVSNSALRWLSTKRSPFCGHFICTPKEKGPHRFPQDIHTETEIRAPASFQKDRTDQEEAD